MEAEWSADKPSLNYLFLGATLSKALPGAQVSFLQRRIFDDGLLDIPLLVEENEKRTAVFAYPSADPESAARYSGARAPLRQREGLSAVCYAPAPIAPAKPAPAIRPLQIVDFASSGEQRRVMEYAGWWRSEADPTFALSPALAALDRWFAALDGRGSVIFSAFISVLELAESKGGQQLFALPEKPLGLPLEAPGDIALCLHASAAEGLWFAIGTKADPLARNRLLSHLAALAESLQKEIDDGGRPPRAEDRRGQAFWQAARADGLRKEAAGGAGLRVLCLAGTKRFPGATTADERPTAVARADPGSPRTRRRRRWRARPRLPPIWPWTSPSSRWTSRSPRWRGASPMAPLRRATPRFTRSCACAGVKRVEDHVPLLPARRGDRTRPGPHVRRRPTGHGRDGDRRLPARGRDAFRRAVRAGRGRRARREPRVRPALHGPAPGGPAVEYRQAYDEPAPGREFTLLGELHPVGTVDSLFPA